MTEMEVKSEAFNLTKEQQRAFNRLKKAYIDCLSKGIYFINAYGTLLAINYDNFELAPYDDTFIERNSIEAYRCSVPNSFKIPNEWTDDVHYFHPIDKFMVKNDGEE